MVIFHSLPEGKYHQKASWKHHLNLGIAEPNTLEYIIIHEKGISRYHHIQLCMFISNDVISIAPRPAAFFSLNLRIHALGSISDI